MADKQLIRQLQWSCRRGMLELDVLLGTFLKEAYENLSPKEQQEFVNLLTHSDAELFLWLTGKTKPQHTELVNLVDKIREHAKHRH